MIGNSHTIWNYAGTPNLNKLNSNAWATKHREGPLGQEAWEVQGLGMWGKGGREKGRNQTRWKEKKKWYPTWCIFLPKESCIYLPRTFSRPGTCSPSPGLPFVNQMNRVEPNLSSNERTDGRRPLHVPATLSSCNSNLLARVRIFIKPTTRAYRVTPYAASNYTHFKCAAKAILSRCVYCAILFWVPHFYFPIEIPFIGDPSYAYLLAQPFTSYWSILKVKNMTLNRGVG